MSAPRRDSAALAVGVVGACCAAPYLLGGPVWDDHTLIFGRLVHLDLQGLASLWVSPVGGGEVGGGYFRPVALSVLAVAGRAGVGVLHLLTLVCHAVSAGILVRMLRPAPAAAWAGALFAVHPLASEVLGWASALPDALSVCLGLLAVRVSTRSLGAAGVLTLLALLSKESAGLLVPAFVLAQRVPRVALVPWAAAVAGALGLRFLASASGAWELAGKGAFGVQHVLWTLGSMAVPWPLTAVRDLHAVPVAGMGVGVLVVVGCALLATRRAADRPAAWGGLALMVLAPVIALPPVLTGYLSAERYAYVGLVGLALWFAAVCPRLRPARTVPTLVLAAGFVLLHLGLAGRWTSDVALFSSAVSRLPDSGYAWHFLGQAQAMKGAYAEAAEAFGQAVQRARPHPRDAELRLRALVMAGASVEAHAWASSLPQEGLTADDVAWRARAALEAGDRQRAATLLGLLKGAEGWEGPAWVPALARELRR